MTEFALTLEGLQKNFDKVPVLKGLTAKVGPGEVIGLLGLNGAVKTTLLETSLGFSLPEGGSACVFGENSGDMDDIKENIVRLQQPAGTLLSRAIRPTSVLRQRQDPRGNTTLLLKDWNSYVAAVLPDSLPAGASFNSLSLKDLFLEMHD